jgi:hypothetical protein
MYAAALVLGAVLAVAAVLFVARPFLRRPVVANDALDEPGPVERRRLELEEERDRALAALKELEFDHRTGKVSDEDYRELVGPLRARAAEALRALEPHTKEAVYPDEAVGNGRPMTAEVQPPTLPPEPTPEPLTPPAPPAVPEPTPVPNDPPAPPQVPEPTPVPHEPPLPGGPEAP